MEPALVVALLWVLFGGTHIGLASGPIRGRLVERLGESGFTVSFALVAAASYAVLFGYYAAHRTEGTAGLALGQEDLLRWVLMAAVAAGIVLATAAVVGYPRSPFALLQHAAPAPRGIERITRHGFLVGVGLLAVAHALLATRLVGTVAMAGFAVLAIVGARHQDGKLLALRGGAYADYLAVTSTVPFAAILSGRQRLVWRELPLGALAAGLGLAFALGAGHAAIFAHGGAWFVGATVGAGAVCAWRSARRARPDRSRPLPGAVALRAGGWASMAIGVAHVAALVRARELFYWAGVGAEMDRAAELHALLPYALTLGAAAVFCAFGLYALSAARDIRALPFVGPGIPVIAAIYLLRAVGGTGAGGFIENTGAKETAFSAVSLALGVLYALGAARGPLRPAPRVAVQRIFGWGIVVLGCAHVLATPAFVPELGEPALWFASGGGAFILVGALNILCAKGPREPTGLTTICALANLVTTAFLVLLAVTMGATATRDPQVLVALGLAAGAALLSLARTRRKVELAA